MALAVRRGSLSTVRVGRHLRIAADAVGTVVADQPLRVALLEAIVDGRLEAPRALNADRPAPSYFDLPAVMQKRVWEDRC